MHSGGFVERIASSTITQEKEYLNQLRQEVGVKGKGEMHHLGPPLLFHQAQPVLLLHQVLHQLLVELMLHLTLF